MRGASPAGGGQGAGGRREGFSSHLHHPAKEPQLKTLLLVTLDGSGSVGSGLRCGGEEQETGVSEKAQTRQHLVKFSGW